jgi:hypothetical protein
VVRLGRSGTLWEFLPLGLRTLDHAPADAEIRLLVAASLVKLRLPTLALEHLDALPLGPEEPGGDPRAAELRAACASMPSDRIDFAQLIATCEANLSCLSAAHNLNLRPDLERWRASAARDEWFRAADGNILRRSTDGVWLSLGDARGAAERFALQHLAPLPGARPRPLEPLYTLEGISPPWLLEQIARHTPPQKDGFWPRLAVIQADAHEFLDALAVADLRDLLQQPRLSFFVGEGAAERFADFLRERWQQGGLIAGPYIPLLSLRMRVEPPAPALLHQAQREQGAEQQRLAEEVHQLYAGRDIAWWRERYKSAGGAAPPASSISAASGPPLRILIPTTRYSTFIQHSSADLAEALRSAGHEARVLIEPDDHSRLSTIAWHRAVLEFEPDLIVLINSFRANLEGSGGASCVPAEVPFVCWIQDALPHQFDARIGRAQGPLDFIVGHLHTELFAKYDFSRERTLALPVVVSEAKFHAPPAAAHVAGNGRSAARSRHECEIAFVSHHSETPRQMHERLMQEAGDPAIGRLFERLFPAVVAIGTDPMGLPTQRARLEAAVAEALRHRSGREPASGEVIPLLRQYALPLAERVLRHQTLEWTADIAEHRGWRFHLYGRGWERHERLAPFARGTAAHGGGAGELREIYQAASVHLHISVSALVHQRIMECALSGGLPICRLTREELEGIASAARRSAMCSAPPPRHHACSTADRRWGLCIADTPELLALATLLQRLGVLHAGTPDEAFLWSPEPRPESIRPENLMPVERRADWVFGDLAQVSFQSSSDLEALIQRAIERPAWRANMSGWIASRVRQRLTHRALITQVLGLIRTSLEQDTAAAGDEPGKECG